VSYVEIPKPSRVELILATLERVLVSQHRPDAEGLISILKCLKAKSYCLLSEGVVEIWLTSEDTGAYGRDIGVTLPDLLWQLVATIPEGARLRLGMTNPPYILEHLEVMLDLKPHCIRCSHFKVDDVSSKPPVRHSVTASATYAMTLVTAWMT
jgi:hypothetical protein